MKIILMFGVLFFLYGCTKSGTHEVVVENKSQYNVQITGYQGSSTYTPVDSFTIKSGFESIIAKIFPEDYVTGCYPPYDSIGIIIIGRPDLKLQIDLNNKDVYQYFRSGNKSKGYHVQCRVRITDADIVPK
ncbi:hypothetical protein [Niabella aquatica]